MAECSDDVTGSHTLFVDIGRQTDTLRWQIAADGLDSDRLVYYLLIITVTPNGVRCSETLCCFKISKIQKSTWKCFCYRRRIERVMFGLKVADSVD